MWLPPKGRVAVWRMLPSTKTAMSVQPPPMSARTTPWRFSSWLRTASALAGGGSGVSADELGGLDAGAFDDLGAVAEGAGGDGVDVGLDAEPLAVHAERV